MSDPTNWLHSTKKLCQVVIEKSEQRIAMPLKEEVTATYPELHELMESVQLHNLKEDDIILIKGLQQHSEATTDGLQNSTEGVMCLSPSPSYNSSSVFCSLRKYSLGFQHAIYAITENFTDTVDQSTEHIFTRETCFPDADPQRIKVPTVDDNTYHHHSPFPEVDNPHLPATDLPISEQLYHQMSVSQRISSPVHSSVCSLAEDIQLPTIITGTIVGNPDVPLANESQFFEELSNYAEAMSTEILSTVITASSEENTSTVKQPKAWEPIEGHISSEAFSHDTIQHSHLHQTFTGIDECPKSSQDGLSTSREEGPEESSGLSKGGTVEVLHYGLAHLANREASSAFHKCFQEVESQMEGSFADDISKSINADSSGEAKVAILPVVENYALRLTHDVISDSTREASLERMMTQNRRQQGESLNSHLAYIGSDENNDLSDMSQSDILTHEINHQTSNEVSSSCAGPLVQGDEQVETLTQVPQRCLDGSSPDRERHFSMINKETADDCDYEKQMFNTLGLTKKGSLDYPDAPPPTPLRPQLSSSQRSFTRKLKGGLAKEFLPSPPPPTPKENINFCLSEEDRETEEKTEFMRKLIRSLSQEFNGKDTTGISEAPEEDSLELLSPAPKSEPVGNSCRGGETVQDYFKHLMSGIVFSSAQVICGIMGESIDLKAPKHQRCDSVTCSDEYQPNIQTSKEPNQLSSDPVIPETEKNSTKLIENKHRDNFRVRMESLLEDYADMLAQKIINVVINFLNQIDLLDHGEQNMNGKSEMTFEDGNIDCRHSCHIKQINSMSEEWVKGIIQSALQVFHTQYRLQQDSCTDPEILHSSEQLQNIDSAGRSIDIEGRTEEPHIRMSLETTKSEVSSEDEVLCSHLAFTEAQSPVTQGLGCGIGIGTRPSPDEGTSDSNNNYSQSLYHQAQVDVITEDLTGKNQSCFVQAETKMSLFEQKEESLRQHKNEDEYLTFHSEAIIEDKETSSTLELSKVLLKDPDHKPINEAYAENLAATILESSLADAYKHSGTGLVTDEMPMCSPNTQQYRKSTSVSNSPDEQCPELQQKRRTKESLKDQEPGVPIIENTKSQILHVVEYTDMTSSKQAQEDLNQSTVMEHCHAEEQESCEEKRNSTFLAPIRAIEVSLVNFQSVAVDAQVQAMLQWAAASQLSITKIRIRTSRDDFVQFPTLLALAEAEEWTVGRLLHSVLMFYERSQTAASLTLFDCLLEHLDSPQTPSKQHMSPS
ncbi:uncharacterized protein si:dkey-171c9.3 [Stegostoma tigrinum]|uniref:uncharacterized protein si:dkey-171c9.3 n=1 Tax=Stegostoma tigrinum TaxID=3053191 RepID=UPI0028706008|nr:uncharacterized protein si:dkey-171c9.3 [Stegostoma tigrinum]